MRARADVGAPTLSPIPCGRLARPHTEDNEARGTEAMGMSLQLRMVMGGDGPEQDAADEGRATERVISLISKPDEERFMAESFRRSKRERDGWGRWRTRLWFWFWLRPGVERTTTGITLEEAIETAMQM